MGPRLQHSSELCHAGSGGYHVTNRTLYTSSGSMRPSDVDALTCGICSKVLRDPVQLISCGCRYCNTCILMLMESSKGCESFCCPADGEKFTRNDIRKDKGCMKEIQQLEVDCPSTDPCGWRGKLVTIESHLQEDCPNAILSCKRNCGASYLRSGEEEHAQECPKREESCEHCLATVPKDDLQDHYASCPEHPLTCDFCHQAIAHRREFEQHLEEVCSECELTCPMAKVLGCSFKGKRSDMAQHSMNSHLLNVLEKVSQLSLTVMSVKADNEELQKQGKEKDKRIEKLERKVVKLEGLVKVISNEDHIERDGGKTTVDAYHRGIGTLSVRDGGSLVKKSPPMYGRMDSYNFEHGREASSMTHMLRETVEKHDNQISRLHENVQSLQQSITQYSIAVDDIRLRQDVQDVKTTHGVFIWKIPDIRRRYRDALDRKTISLYSPPFQTSPHGYRMCVRVYLNGDGAGKGTYVSLFFVLMRSEHDDLLSYPFKQSVRFTLINQETQAESITEAFAPDLKSQSFQKPEGEMNVASGFPKFARQTVLHDERFTKNNTIYIKAKVDLAGLALD